MCSLYLTILNVLKCHNYHFTWNFSSHDLLSQDPDLFLNSGFFSNNFDVLADNCDFLSSNLIIAIYDLT